MKFVKKSPILSHKPVPHGGLFSIKHPNPQIIDFSSNVSPAGTPPLVKKTIKKHTQTLSIYPDPDSIKLRKNLEWYTKIPYSQIIVGNGATEIIYNFCKAFLSKNIPILIPIPTFGEYEAACKLQGCKIDFFKTMNLNESIDEFVKKIPKNGCVFVCNPNNPTGILIKKKEMLKIIKTCKERSTILFIDECFIELVPESDESMIKFVKKFDNLFILRSLTKSFALAGLRIGYGVGSKEMSAILNKIKVPWNVNGIAQIAAGAALCHSFYLKKANKIIKNEIGFLTKKISKIDGFECKNTSTNFILIKTKKNSKFLQKKLLSHNILIRDCSTIRGLDNRHIRIAVKTRKENEKIVKALEKIK